MNKKEFIRRTADVIRDNGMRKAVKVKRHVFHISDDSGNDADFVVKEQDKQVLYTSEDITTVVEACLAVIEDAIKHGESISIQGFGSLGVHKRAARKTKQPGTDEWCDVEARYVPKFQFGNTLRLAARVYELTLEDEESRPKIHDPYDDI